MPPRQPSLALLWQEPRVRAFLRAGGRALSAAVHSHPRVSLCWFESLLRPFSAWVYLDINEPMRCPASMC
jgi:hypothetical protein